MIFLPLNCKLPIDRDLILLFIAVSFETYVVPRIPQMRGLYLFNEGI